MQKLEGEGEEEAAKREEQLQKVITFIIPCDATEDQPVPPGCEGPYDVVVEISVLNIICICSNEDDLVATIFVYQI